MNLKQKRTEKRYRIKLAETVIKLMEQQLYDIKSGKTPIDKAIEECIEFKKFCNSIKDV